MQRISLAPVLSATRTRDSCWIISVSPAALLGLLEDLHDAPPLGRGQRPGLHQPDAVTHAGGVVAVMGLQLAGPPDDLAVERVLETVFDSHDDRLVHLVAHDVALADLAEAPLLVGFHTHAVSSLPGAVVMFSSRSRMIV